MTITTPTALLLLLVLAPIFYLGWPRRRYRRARDVSSLFVRTVIVLLLVFALAGVQMVQSADRLAVVFVVDVSDSMGTDAQESAFNFIEEALPDMSPDDLAGVIVFGGDAQVARSLSNTRDLGPIRAVPETGNTDLAEAVRLGLALFPSDAARRMVVLSDGQITVGDTLSAAQLAIAAGVEISYVQFSSNPGPEVQVRDIRVPAVLSENQEFDLTVTITSESNTEADLSVLASGEIIYTERINLRQGTNTYSLPLRSGDSGFRDFSVQVNVVGDGSDVFYQNNELSTFSRVQGDPRILVISNDPSEVQYLIPALEESGLEVDVESPSTLPTGITPLIQYDTVILANIPALDFSESRMQDIETYVEDLGGGLVVIGGPEAYGPGGYFQTPLEQVLPVEMQLEDQQRIPQLTIAYVIDRSGSMGTPSARGIPYIDLAKEAIIRSIDFLQPTDRAAVASFDAQAYWIAEFQDVLDREDLQRLVASLRASGGTNIRAGMRLVEENIVDEPSEIKHIILLTDGGADSAGLIEQVERLNLEENTTTSVISIGDFQAPFLQEMADAGGGNYHHVLDADTIPSIFSLETVLATRSYIMEGEFVPQATAINPTNLHPILRGIDSIPHLQGYVATTARPTAQTILRTPDEFQDPILAAWQYGLGRSIAFTSDATARWGANWVNWSDYTRFWSQTIRWTMTEGTTSNLETQVIMDDELARIIVDARDDNGAFLNGLDLETRIVLDPEQPATVLQLQQIAPGRYEGTFVPLGEGAHLIHVTDSLGGEVNYSQTNGWVMTYSPEYQIRETTDTVLAEVAELTGGESLLGNADAVFAHNINATDISAPIAPLLLLIAMLLLPLDIAIRRLIITQTDLRRLYVWVSSKIGPPERTEESRQQLSALREARNRAREAIPSKPDDTPSQASTPTSAPTSTSSIGALRRRRDEVRANTETSDSTSKPVQPAKPRYKRPVPSAQKSGKSESGENIGSRLLKSRRRDNDDNEKK